jgi:hypothetical protein
MDLRYIALYLPQFHPIKENNEWWGEGFTEWTNVAKAKPLFNGHKQPILPADFGFYDLRLEQTRIEQAQMAKEYGIDGFCYYHYWFHGKRLLERPANDLLNSKKPDFPFCFCWANETWSRRWIGDEKEVLIKQEYSDKDDEEHANYLCEFFSDERYIKVDGRPVFVIYRPGDLPNATKTIETIKRIALEKGLKEPFLVASNSHLWDNEQLLSFGFDSILNFRPQLGILPYANSDEFSWGRLKRNLKKYKLLDGKLKIFDYNEAVEIMQIIEPENFDQIIPSVFVGWDNTARRGKNGIVMKDNHPEYFEKELLRVTEKLSKSNSKSQILFINAWNEWAEGNKLEPDSMQSNKHLEVVKKIKCSL